MVKNRNMILQILIFAITFGLYSGYWYFETLKEMKFITQDEEAKPMLWTILLIFPIANIYSLYKYSELFNKISSEKLNKWILFILWLVFQPAVWFIVQSDLNAFAEKQNQ